MRLIKLFIAARERLLDFVSGSNRTRTLNQFPAQAEDLADGDLACELFGLLHEILSSGIVIHGETVNYAALHDNPLYNEFRRCTGKLYTFNPSDLPDRNARLAFWINLYNTLVLDGVIAFGIKNSIMERRAGITFFRQAAYKVGGQRMSCDDIEHGILRANRGHPFLPGRQFGITDRRLEWVIEPFDARVHFALNCASRSCPPIRAYTAERIDEQLDLATRNYLANDVQSLPKNNTLVLSSIFKWFGRDFGGRDGIIDFVLLHFSDREEFSWLSNERDSVVLRYKPYDWTLNS